MKKIIAIAACLFFNCSANERIVILIHGTWAHESSIPFMNYVCKDTTAKWFEPEHAYYENLKEAFQAPIVSFIWSGYNKHDHRIEAAHKLTNLINSYPPDTEIIIVSHSHGSNVGFIASQIIAKDSHNQHRIAEFYAFGTPINLTDYHPDMRVITQLYHCFSFEDMVQPVLGMFERTLPEHERIKNIRIFVENKEPDHANLHHPVVARWIRSVGETLREKKDSQPHLIRFFDDNFPQFELDLERERMLERDSWLQRQLSYALFRNQKTGDAAPRDELDEGDMRVIHHLFESMHI